MSGLEVHVELLLGRKTRDADGRLVGRIEELVAKRVDDEIVVIEYHIGPAALLERLLHSATRLPIVGLLPRRQRAEYCVLWDQMDLSDPAHPRTLLARDQLIRREPEPD
jgi:hypothetical protein